MRRFALVTAFIIAINGALSTIVGLLTTVPSNLYEGAALILAGSVAWYGAVLVIMRIKAERDKP